jgi:thiamine biosynthesis lipoprotein
MTKGAVFARFDALGCLAVVGATEADAMPLVLQEVRAEVAACDLACSRFRDDSELSSLNDPSRAQVAVLVSSWLADALVTAIWAARETEGLVDPTIGQCLVDLGYDRSFEMLRPDQPLVVRATHVPAWARVDVRERPAQSRPFEAQFEVRVPLGARLDLGATAKALCADRAACRANNAAGCGVLVSLGGDVAVAGASPQDGWPVRVTDRADANPALDGQGQTVAVRTGGLATSGTSARRWAQEGRQRHHLVDPRTAQPAEEVWRTVSVAAASCVEANVASTASIILAHDAPDWLSGRDVHARLVAANGEVVFVGAWPTDAPASNPLAALRDEGDEGDGVVAA